MSRKYYNKHEEKLLENIKFDNILKQHKKEKKEEEKYVPSGGNTLLAVYENRVLAVCKKTKLIRREYKYVIDRIIACRDKWIRRPEEWKCKSHNVNR